MNDPDPQFPGGYPVSPPELILDSPSDLSVTTDVKKQGFGSRFALAAMAIAVVAAGGIAARAALQPASGPASSDEAITQFFAALDADDLIGLAELIHPAERESIAEPMLDMLEHARRLELVAAEGTDPDEVTFTDTKVEGLTYTVEETGPRLHYATTTGGTVTTPNDSSFPAGPLFDRFDIDLPETESGSTVEDLGKDPVRIAVVENDGSWYVSLWYSVAEDIRREEGLRFSELGSGPVPVGAESPDAVMENMARAMADLDPEAVLTQLDPSEAAVLYDYSPLFLGELEDVIDEIRSEAEEFGVSWSLDSVDFDATEANGRQIVSLAQLGMSFEYDQDGESKTASYLMEDGCTIVTVEGETTNSCTPVDNVQAPDVEAIVDDVARILDLSDVTINAFEKLTNVEVGLTVVERDGRWYLSLMPTVLETANDHLAVLEPEDLVAVGTDIEEIIEDSDRVIEEMLDLWLNTDFDSLQGGEAGMSALGELAESLTRGPALTFEDVDSAISSDGFTTPDDGSYNEPELGLLADVLIDPEDWYPIDFDFSYLSWETWELDTPNYLGGAYSFGESYIEVLQFDSPVDPAALNPELFSLETVNGLTQATNFDTGSVFTFVGDYVVWNSPNPQSETLAGAQIERLR